MKLSDTHGKEDNNDNGRDLVMKQMKKVEKCLQTVTQWLSKGPDPSKCHRKP